MQLLVIECNFAASLSVANDAGIAQLVEHNLAKVGVASSSLVSRSNSFRLAAVTYRTVG